MTRSSLGSAMLVELALKERIGVTAESAGWRQRGRLLERLAASGVAVGLGRGASAYGGDGG